MRGISGWDNRNMYTLSYLLSNALKRPVTKVGSECQPDITDCNKPLLLLELKQ